MKKFLFSFILAMAGLSGYAQRNSILVYGNLGINSSKTASDIKTSSFSFSPGVGYQWDDHWTGGVNFQTTSGKTGSPEIKTTSFGAGPFVRYAYPLSDIFAVYGQLNTSFLSGKTSGVKMAGFESTLFPAIGVNLKNGFALNFNFGSLGFATGKVKGEKNSSSFGLNFGSGAGFGISKNFGL
ncbi:Outer membrane protein beta-barrel domain-containing protein [Dyadobacter koreensis]|uniref:Outer membrane protein beta-barrel domain-containing protein n=1 Tax=Dyadobacter koreensis TaxID=408657 RepID=A0A1H6V300_9BACT|nr:outer membrane beta-barrel protein [Dyadobacter koreensis]SEI98969.1 Outer membrane protein beta-barrel domain-containing protein [Dyadobacter koreensis]